MAFDWQSVTLVIVPGRGDSGPEHWQSRWERAYARTRRVMQRDWDNPVRAEWVAALDATLSAVIGPVILVGHSAGSMTIVQWAAGRAKPVVGALLVTPPDFEGDIPGLAPQVLAAAGWTPIPRGPLPFAAVLVASMNDPYATLPRSAEMARWWGARLVNVGEAGHLNSESGFGPWPEGERLLEELAAAARRNPG